MKNPAIAPITPMIIIWLVDSDFGAFPGTIETLFVMFGSCLSSFLPPPPLVFPLSCNTLRCSAIVAAPKLRGIASPPAGLP